ncbi:hypothetical protein EVJ58_g2289 [Rhodofomes roseus]|uniref:Fork-head domain-containing protein n=1 Tax=Rhodofomes roseus TaxID=34475 RepID=A0A4Y9YR61_9APHY|nr:hypothetical protein EVJ58_g2289 [Rhodofomes roseus]
MSVSLNPTILFLVHKVKPDAVEEYRKAAEQYYSIIKDDPELHVKLTGSWETVLGEQDTFVHILEYENYKGYDMTTKKIRDSDYIKAYRKMLPHLVSRSSQLNQEFAILPTAPPHSEGGIFELRTYQLHPGTLLQWEHTWRKGIEARRKFVEPVGAWFSQVGRLHQVHHMWQYPDLQTRKETREKAWKLDGWAETVSKPPSPAGVRCMQPPMTSLNNLLNPESTYEYNRRVTQAHSNGSPASTTSSPPATISTERTVEENYYGQTNISITPHEPHPNCPDTLTCLPDTDGRPQHTLPVILRCAILGSPKRRLTIREIYAAMEKKYPYYKTAGPAWKRQPRPATDPGFGSYWTVNLDAPPGTKRPRKRGRANKDAPANNLPLETDALQAPLGHSAQTSLPPSVPPSHSHPSLPQSLSHASLPHPLSHHPIPPPLPHSTSAPSVTPSLPPQRPPSISPSAQPPTPHSATNSAPSSAQSSAPTSAPPFPKVREQTAESEYRLQDPPIATLRPVDSRSFNQGSTLRSAKYYDEDEDEDDMEWEEEGTRISDYDSAEDTPYQYDPRQKPSTSGSHPPHSLSSVSGRPALYGAFSSYASNPTHRSPETQPYKGPEPPPPPGYKGSDGHAYRGVR